MARFQYQGFVEPLNPDPPSVATWQRQQPDPVRRAICAALYVAATGAFVPVVAAAATQTIHGEQGGGAVSTTRLLQYQACAAPVLVPSAAETITLDKWAPTYPDRARRTIQIPAGFTVGPLHVPDVTDPVPDRSWAPAYPDRVPPRPRAVDFPSAIAPLEVPDVTVPAPSSSSWTPSYPDRLVRGSLTATVATTQNVDPISPPPVVPDQWSPSYPDGVPPARRVVAFPQAVAPLHVPDVTQPVPDGSWAPTYPDQVRRPQLTGPQVGAQNVEPVVTAAVITFGGAQGVGSAPRLALLQYQALAAPVVVPVVVAETITADKWAPRYEIPRRPRFDVNRIDTIEWAFVEDVPDFKLAVYPDRVAARSRAIPSQIVGPLVVPAVVVPDRSWAPVYPDRAPGRERRTPPIFIAQNILPIPNAPDVAPDRSWAPIYPDQIRTTPRTRTGSIVWPVFVPDVTNPVPPLSWAPHCPHFVIRAERPALGSLNGEDLTNGSPGPFAPAWSTNANLLIDFSGVSR